MTNITANPFDNGSDELERLALEECTKRQRLDHRASVLILPTTNSRLATQLTDLGAKVTLAAPESRRQDIQGRIIASGRSDQLRYLPCEFPEQSHLPADDGPFDMIVVQRGLCQFTYQEAKQLIRQLLKKLRIGGKLYLSILGLHSELGEGYQASEQILANRFAPLNEKMACKYDLSGNLCLYTERDLFLLILESGASVLRTLTTTWGNVKGIAVRV